MNVKMILDRKEYELLDLLQCNDVVLAYRSNNKEISIYFGQKSTVFQIIELVLSTKSPQILKQILDIFVSTENTVVSKILSSDSSLMRRFFSFMDHSSSCSNHLVSILMQILSFAFSTWTEAMYSMFASNTLFYLLLIKRICLMPVFAFINNSISKCIEGRVFVWFLFSCLMDEHGTGSPPPAYLQYIVYDNYRLSTIQRTKALECLISYFKLFSAENEDIVEAITISLPLLLSDSSDDNERSLVFQLGSFLAVSNEMIKFSREYIINSISSPGFLHSIIVYLNRFQVSLQSFEVYLFINRLFKKTPNNTLIPHAIKLIASSDRNDIALNSFLRQNIISKIDFSNSKYIKTILIAIVQALDGILSDPLSFDFPDCFVINSNSPVFEIDSSKVSALNKRLAVTSPAKINPREMWGDKVGEMEKKYQTIDRLKHIEFASLKNSKTSRSKSPSSLTPDNTPNRSLSSQDDSVLRNSNKSTKDFRPKAPEEVRRKKESISTSHKRTHSGDVPSFDEAISKDTEYSFHSFKSVIPDIIVVEDDFDVISEPNVKAPITPPPIFPPHRPLSLSPQGKSKKLGSQYFEIPEKKEVILSMCSLFSSDFFETYISSESQTIEFVKEQKSTLTEPPKRPILVLDLFDPFSPTCEKNRESFPQLSRTTVSSPISKPAQFSSLSLKVQSIASTAKPKKKEEPKPFEDESIHQRSPLQRRSTQLTDEPAPILINLKPKQKHENDHIVVPTKK